MGAHHPLVASSICRRSASTARQPLLRALPVLDMPTGRAVAAPGKRQNDKQVRTACSPAHESASHQKRCGVPAQPERARALLPRLRVANDDSCRCARLHRRPILPGHCSCAWARRRRLVLLGAEAVELWRGVRAGGAALVDRHQLVLPRWADSAARKLRPGTFSCADNPDASYASCDVPEFLPVFVPWQ